MPQVLFVGLTTIDIQYFVDQFPESNQKVKCAPPAVLVGGPAANASIGFAFLNGSGAFLTAIGQNPFNQFIHSDIEAFNVKVTDFLENQIVDPILASVVTSANGDRAILSHHPNNHPIKLDVGSLLDQIKPAVVMVDGFYPDMMLAVCKEAKQRNILVVFDGGSWKVHLDKLIPFLDIVICSADFRPPGCSDHQDVFDFFSNQGVGKVAISRGDKSILYCEEGETSEIQVGKQENIDTLGAGDFLHGAFCYYWSESFDFKGSLKKASKFASATCRYPGTRSCFKELDRNEFL